MRPPGPRSSLLATHGVAFDPVGAARAWEARYGAVVSLPLLSGLTIQISDPSLVRELFQAPPDSFLPGVPEPLDVIIGERSVLNLSGTEHRRERKLLGPSFRSCRLESWAAEIAEVARRAIDSLGEGQDFRALELAQSVTLEVILRVVFGVEGGSYAPMHAAVCEMLDATHPVLLFTRLTQRDLFGLSPWRRFRHASEALDALLFERIAWTRAQLERSPDELGDSVLALMLAARYDDGGGMTNADVRDQLRTLLFAGHETTANVLAWSLYYLHRDRPLLAELRAELDTVDAREPAAYFRLPLLRAVINESLRIRPPLESVFRRLARPYTLGPWTIPAGATLAPSIVLVHHDPALYPDPERFAPGRFLARQPPVHEFFPFGGGARRCVGATFARFEACLVLATILCEARLELLDDGEVGYGRENMSLGPIGGIRMRRRTSSPLVSASSSSSSSLWM